VTGFTGKLSMSYLVEKYGVNGSVTWAIAGRSAQKLKNIKDDIMKESGNLDVKDVHTILVDTSKRESLHDLVRNTRVVISTAGPFALMGSNVVEFCARYGTSYVDITGEVDWSKSMIAKWDFEARKTGAKIISFCGHDSIPWDLTSYKLAEKLATECDDDLLKTECYNEMNSAGASGGTIKTFLMGLDGSVSPKYVTDPWLQKNDGTKSAFRTKIESPLLPEKVVKLNEKDHKWNSYFVMSAVNGAVVRRTNALISRGNRKVTYREGLLSKDFKSSFVNSFGLYIAGAAILNPITGYFLRKKLPTPGQGPSKKKMQQGYLCVHGIGIGSKGNQVESAFYFPRDAGYLETARMVVESGLCLALDSSKLPIKNGGFYTPASGMGDALLERLCKTGSMFRCRIRSKL